MGNRQTRTWETLPVENDGWVRSHNALRLDIKDLSECIGVMRSDVSVQTSSRIDSSKTAALIQYWDHFADELQMHHDSEEKHFFPNMATRVTLPPKMSVDHKTLMESLKAATTSAHNLASLQDDHQAEEYLEALTELGTALAQLETLLEEHFKEEETVALPLLRANFTREEAGAWAQAMSKELPWSSMPHLLRPFAGEETKRQIMIDMGIPWFIVSMVLMPRVRRYADEYESLLTRMRKPRQAAPSSSVCR
eukprot:m.8717 g.8717  ORF g.8717 m.8717 type:complete len:251 (+) comp5278_c0_seq1:185-937(+)